MKTPKPKKWRKIFGILFASLLAAGAAAGIGFGSYKISQTTNVSNDFSNGRSIQLNLRLFKLDDQGNVLVNKDTNEPIRLYDKQEEEQNIKESATALVNKLQSKGLTNIKVSYGSSYIENKQTVKVNGKNQDLFKNQQEPIFVLYASFENSETAFGLDDTEKSENDLLNDKKVYDSLNKYFAYEFEVVKPSYKGKNYQIKGEKNNTFRNPTTGIFSKDGVYSGNEISYYDTYLMQNNGVSIFKDWDNKESNDYISYTLKDDKTIPFYNSYQFGEESKEYKQLEEKNNEGNTGGSTDTPTTYEGESSSDANTEPTELQKFQTEYTWFVWKDKQGLIDYLNSLIGIWYFNIYANKVENVNWASTDKTEIFSKLFPTGDSPSFVRNGTSTDARKKINKIIDNLTDVEKSFIAHIVSNQAIGNKESLLWTPPLIQEDDLIPVLYNFLNDKTFTPATLPENGKYPNDNPDGVSKSVVNGWSFLESTNTALSSFIGQYYVGTIDYRNFNTYFESPTKPAEKDESSDKPVIPEPFVTKQLKISSSDLGVNSHDLAEILNNKNVKFPVFTPNTTEFIKNWGRSLDVPPNQDISKLPIVAQFAYINNNLWEQYKNDKITWEQFSDYKNQFANHYFIGDTLFSEQYITPPTIITTNIGLDPLGVLLVIIGGLVFLVGIFVSVRYRIPGLFAFIISGLVYVLSILLYNVFGFVYSFYSLLAAALGTLLSFIVPSFLFKNIKKEISEGSTLSAAILKSTKKYWKTGLDTHIMGILASLAFLFFGSGGNINFGAMLIISVFLSFILSGIIYYILLLFYVYVIQFDGNQWFLSKREFNKLSSFNEKQSKKILMFNKVKFFNKPNYIVLGAFILIGLIGSILVATNGPFFSLDFGSSNILVINNFDSFKITKQNVIDALNVNTLNAYVNDNQLVIYTLNNLSIDSVINSLSKIIDAKLISNLYDNTLVTVQTPEIALDVVQNTLKCMGIAIGLCAVWSLLSLNIVSVIPFALIQVLSMVVLVGFSTLVAIPLDINSIPVFIFIFVMSTCFSASMISSVKKSWNKKIHIRRKDLEALFENIYSKINMNYFIIASLIALFSVLSIGLGSISLVFPFLILFIGSLYLMFLNNNLSLVIWFVFIIIRDLFSNELLKTKHSQVNHSKDYDKVNEQKIYGINC